MSLEKPYQPISGWLALSAALIGTVLVPLLFGFGAAYQNPILIVLSFISLPVVLLVYTGLIAVQPNEARAFLLFGSYKGTVRKEGFYWVNPFFSKKRISLRIRNFETGSLEISEEKDAMGKVTRPKSRTHGKPSKVNDRNGNPIDISAVVVWRVVDTAEALFEVDDYEHYVAVQSEAALRSLAARHPYDSEDHETSLRGSTGEISDQLIMDIQERLNSAGVEVIEARISHLAYASEIAAAMLQRQQAQAVVAARAKIVEGAVGMVHMALEHLAKDNIVNLDDERRAAMVSNLLVVLCGDRQTQPVINAGSLYN